MILNLGETTNPTAGKEKSIEKILTDHLNNNTHLTAGDREDLRKFLWAVDDILGTGTLSVRKVYASITAMNADTSPTDGETGKPLKFGQLVSIANVANLSDPDNGKVYRRVKNGWDLSFKLGNFMAAGMLVDTSLLADKSLTDSQKVALAVDLIKKDYQTSSGAPVVNVSFINNKYDYADDSAAIAAVPVDKRKLGLSIKYMSADGWKTLEYSGSSIDNWNSRLNWTDKAQLTANIKQAHLSKDYDYINEIRLNFGSFYINSTGDQIANNDCQSTDYIDCTNYVCVIPMLYIYLSGYCAWYDENKVLISTFQVTNSTYGKRVFKPVSAKFVRFSAFVKGSVLYKNTEPIVLMLGKDVSIYDGIDYTGEDKALAAKYGKILDDKINQAIPHTYTSFKYNSLYNTATASNLNLTTNQQLPAGKLTRIKLKAIDAGTVKFAILKKLTETPTFHVISTFDKIVTIGENEIVVNVDVLEPFHLGILATSARIATASGNVGDAITLHYTTSSITDTTTWSSQVGRGHNIEFDVVVQPTIMKDLLYNGLDYTGEGKALDARQAAALVALINTISGGNSVKITTLKWCACGDSITDFCNSPSSNGTQYIGYDQYILSKIYFPTVYNQGYSGIKLAQSGGFAATKVSGLPIADLYTIYLGTNDFALTTQTTIGTITDYFNNTGVNTFYGALRVLIDGIYAKNANAIIILFTPTHRNYSSLNSWNSVNSNGNTLNDFANAIRDVSNYMGLPVLDLMKECRINNNTFSQATYDNLHPNSIGYKYIADAFIRKFYDLF